MGFLSCFLGCTQKILRIHRSAVSGGVGENADDGGKSLDLFSELCTLQVATNFSSELNQLDHGLQGFAPVYKGLMPNGQVVAVKKLSLNSREDLREVKNEVKLLSRIQHNNLVKLLGCCAGPEKMLVYEYLPNKSLDCFLFDKKNSPSLDWSKRFQIVTGVAQGLLYLHQEAPEMIIHSDIKATNILLDDQFNPKISNFGLARFFPRGNTHVNTFRICGIRGYMAPEHEMHGYLSVKTDVFSFGVLVLEIVSGRKNHDGQLGGEKADLLTYAWMLFESGKTLELVDPSLAKCKPDGAALCVQLGLLCCQTNVADRPDMKSVHLMLTNSDSFTLPRPGKPGIQGRGQGRQWTTITTSTLTSTNASSTNTGITKFSCR